MITVKKERETYIYKDEFELALDDIKDLGFFLEIETIKDFGTIENARKSIMNFAKILGIDEKQIVDAGYPHLLMKKKGLI